MKDKYVVGLDYGTLSARAAVVCCTGGVCAGEQVLKIIFLLFGIF